MSPLALLSVDPGLRDRDGETPLYMACAHGQLEVVKAMLHRHADVNKQNKDGNTCLHAAASNGTPIPCRSIHHA